MSLFDASPISAAAAHGRQAPLAERMRPQTLDEYVGQDHLLGPGKPLRLAIERAQSAFPAEAPSRYQIVPKRRGGGAARSSFAAMGGNASGPSAMSARATAS